MRVALTTIGSLGDIVPFSTLARRLADRGHRVTVLSWADYEGHFRGPGIRFVGGAGGGTRAGLAEVIKEAVRAPDPARQMRLFARYFYFENAPEAYFESALSALRDQELAVCNVLDHIAQEAAEQLGLTWIGFKSKPPNTGAALEQEERMLRDADAELTAQLLRLGGRRERVRLFRESSPRLNLLAVPRAMIRLPRTLSPPHRVTGAWLAARDPSASLAPSLEHFVAAGDSPLCVTFGSVDDGTGGERLGVVREALEMTGRRAVVQLSGAASRPETSSASADAATSRLVRVGFVSYPALFQRVRAVIHHGGAGTLVEATRAGRPSVGVPHMADQFFWAQKASRLQLGPAPLPRWQLTAPRLAERIEALERPTYAHRARRMAKAIAREDGVGTAARLIEEVAS